MAFAFTLAPDTNNSGPITMVTTDTATIVTRTNIGGTNGSGGTGTIIGTITIETTTGIDASRFSDLLAEVRYEIITFCPCAGLWRIDFSIL